MRLEIAGLCFTDADGVAFHHDISLVVLSYVIAAGGWYAALEIIERWRNARGVRAHYWHLASTVALGGSIWSAHFIGMLALKIDLPLTYAPGMALLSLVIAIGVVGLGTQITRAKASRIWVGVAGITVGLGVAAMHYVGMAGVIFAGRLAYTPSLWSLSVLIAIAAATVALWLSLTLEENWQRAVAALIMGVAICGMHYTGMASTVFLVDPLAQVTPALSTGPLAAAVALTTLALIVCALVFVAADRRLLAAARRDAEVLHQANGRLAQMNAELDLGRQRFEAVLDNVTQGICLFDNAQRLLVSNARYAEIYDLAPEAIRAGRSLKEIANFRHAAGSTPDTPLSDYVAGLNNICAASRPLSSTMLLKNGRVVAIYFHPMPDGGWVATHEDITERRRAEASILYMARHDALTRLPNRVMFQERLEQAIELADRGKGYAVLCLDLDHFKLVNDTLGHPVGDGLLRSAAERLQACVRQVDTVARLGGDEFAIIQVTMERPEDAAVLATRILTAFGNPFDVEGHHIMVGTSIGVAVAPADGTSSEKLLKNADIALYLAKAEGRGTVRFFEPEMDARIQSRRRLELDLRAAIAGRQFEVYYQPLVNLTADRVSGFEALLRWHHPIRGLVSPGEFIPLAEETGMIVAIGEWVLKAACLEAANWSADIKLAINLSPVQFKKGDLVAAVQAALDASGLSPDRLELEITELVLLQNTEKTLAVLHQLRAAGIAVALDDFGTGYSSLSYLRSFPFDKIKIDQSFVRDLTMNNEAMSIVRAVTGLGHSLCMKTTAEGVETMEQLDQLRQEGCTEVQGYIFSRPQPAHELPSLIERLRNMSTSVM